MSNADLAAKLNELAQIAEMFGEQYRAANYMKAALAIKNGKKFTAGEHIAAKIAEYHKTSEIKELNDIKKSDKYRTYYEFSRILGVGPSTIKKWTSLGIDTLLKLRQMLAINKLKLTKMQMYGLRYYADLNTKIPRDDVEWIGRRIISMIAKIAGKKFIAEIAGSYRRGAMQSGDIDIVCSGPSCLLSKVAEKLHDEPYFIDILAAGPEKIMFLYKSPIYELARQIDLINVPRSSYFTALAYLTGSWNHNETLRGIAKAKGYRLNQTGLYRGKNMTRIPISSEKDIYAELGVEYVAPKDRI